MQEQGNSDSVLDDVACLLSCTRTSLHGMPLMLVVCCLQVAQIVSNESIQEPFPGSTSGKTVCGPAEVCSPAVVASEKGVVVGRLRFSEDGDPIDCSRMGVGGKAIPPNVDKVMYPSATETWLNGETLNEYMTGRLI